MALPRNASESAKIKEAHFAKTKYALNTSILTAKRFKILGNIPSSKDLDLNNEET